MLAVTRWGDGGPVVLVHGSLALGAEEWQAQRPLADEGFGLIVPDRRGYGASPGAVGEDFLADADDLFELIGEGAHVVGHSYGGLSALYAAARRPGAIRSLVLLEAPLLMLGTAHQAVRDFGAELRRVWEQPGPDSAWLDSFLKAVGSDPADLPEAVLASLLLLVPITRGGRPPWEAAPDLAAVRQVRGPKLVVSGGHSAAFDLMGDALAEAIGGTRHVVTGAGHEIQFAGEAINVLLLDCWRGAAA